MAIVLITGGSGLIGRHLTLALQRDGHQVRWFSRSKPDPEGGRFAWDLERGTLDEAALDGIDHVVHLAGAGIADKRWNAKRVAELITSRTRGPQLLFAACRRRGHWPRSFVSAAGIGYYGARTTGRVFTEDDPPGADTIARISLAWENSLDPWKAHTRVVKLRTPVVLARDGGALARLGRIARLGLASPLGTGRQILPWIHIADLVDAYRMAMTDENWHGAYNIVAADQPDNRRFMRTLAQVLHRPFILPPVPGFVLRTVVGEVADALLNGSGVSSARARDLGWRPKHEHLTTALADVLTRA